MTPVDEVVFMPKYDSQTSIGRLITKFWKPSDHLAFLHASRRPPLSFFPLQSLARTNEHNRKQYRNRSFIEMI